LQQRTFPRAHPQNPPALPQQCLCAVSPAMAADGAAHGSDDWTSGADAEIEKAATSIAMSLSERRMGHLRWAPLIASAVPDRKRSIDARLAERRPARCSVTACATVRI
jgi:hypothetical protein